jgi:hypothetical protein
MELSGQLHTPVDLIPREYPHTYWTEAWEGLRAGLDAVVKTKIFFAALAGNRNWVVQPKAYSRY